MNAHSKKAWFAWLPAVIWLVLIAVESTNSLSAANTNRFLYPIFHFFTGVDREHFEPWHYYIRKGGHFVGYFVLSVLLFRAWRATLPMGSDAKWSFRWGAIAWFNAGLVAFLDEWHQMFLSSRTGTVRDMLLDTTAALIAQLLVSWYWKTRRRCSNAIGLPVES